MATITQFEELEIRQLARELCQEVYNIIITTSLGKNSKLRDQIDSSSGSIMDNIAVKALKVMGKMNSGNFYLFQKAHVVKHDLNYIGYLTEIILIEKSLKKQKT